LGRMKSSLLIAGLFAVLVMVLLGAPAPAAAQPGHPSEVVTITPVLPRSGFHPGETFRAALILDISSGYHLNSHSTTDPALIPTTVEPDEESPVAWSFIRYPEDLARSGRTVLGLEGERYHDRVVIRLVGRVPEESALGTLTVPLAVRYQTCTDQLCLFPFTKETAFEIPVVTEGTPVRSLHPEIFERPGGGSR